MERDKAFFEKVDTGFSQKNAIEQETEAENCEENEAATEGRELPPAALRALAEAEQRRHAQEKLKQEEAKHVREIGGRGGQDPARFGDWEVKGRAIDF